MCSATAPRREKTSAQTYEFGKPITGADKEGDRLTTVVNWDGPTLVFVTTEQEGKRTIETRETWSLSDDGRTLIKVRRTPGRRGDVEQRYILEKVGG